MGSIYVERVSINVSCDFRGIVDFLSTEQECNVLDKSHTPPAPLMTKPQQRIAALLVDMKDPVTFQFVQSGIEYKLFRLNQMLEVRMSFLSL